MFVGREEETEGYFDFIIPFARFLEGDGYGP